jgi:hypothetical protein
MTRGKMAVYWTFACWVGFMGGALILLGGCTAEARNEDLFQASEPAPTEPPKKDPPQTCPSIYLACEPGETDYADEAACKREQTTCRRLSQPACAGPQWCGKTEVQCTAFPACDPDDEQVPTCPKGASCYARTVCGTTILCQRPFTDG